MLVTRRGLNTYIAQLLPNETKETAEYKENLFNDSDFYDCKGVTEKQLQELGIKPGSQRLLSKDEAQRSLQYTLGKADVKKKIEYFAHYLDGNQIVRNEILNNPTI